MNLRITRARAKSCEVPTRIAQQNPSLRQDEKKIHRANPKRSAPDEKKPTIKRRAALTDVTNIFCGTSDLNFVNEIKTQNSKHVKRDPVKKKSKLVQVVSVQQKVTSPLKREGKKVTQRRKAGGIAQHGQLKCTLKREKESDEKCCLSITDIDANHNDPRMCSIYALEIYEVLRVIELDQRHSADFMETVQRDINQIMRGILIGWLVEVSEEYKLASDTLYLAVYLIDQFLSQNYIEKQRLQLLGVTCMLIASKYEEMCAPRVEDFCIITDNSYTREEVLKMEIQVLNFIDFRLSVPTTKKFLRRFIQAAQASYKVHTIELEFLASYLAELTLIEYCFLKFLPSLIAASAVFLAKWTLDQSDHPWNPTLEHYTKYKASELKATVLRLQDLQLNSKDSSLNAIRDKYRQEKFKHVATLTSPTPFSSHFESTT